MTIIKPFCLWLLGWTLALTFSTPALPQSSQNYDGDRNIEEDILREHLQSVLDGNLQESNPLDVFRLLNQRFYPLPNSSFASVGRLQLVVKDRNGRLHGQAYADQMSSMISIPDQGIVEIHYRGTKVMDVFVQSRAVGFFGNYLVWVTPGLDDLHANLSFMDLGKYWSFIGRADIPMFRIPIKAPYEHASFSFVNGRLVNHDHNALMELDEAVFAEFSDLQEIGFNIVASLLDPKTYEDTKNLVSEIDLVFNRALEIAGKSSGNLNNSSFRQEEVIQVIKDVVRRIEPHDLSALKVQEVASGYRDEVIQRGLLAKSAENFQANRVEQQKLLARLRLLWWRLSLPEPKQASMSIKKGLAMAAMGGLKGDSDTVKEGVLQIVNKRLVKFGTPIAAAALLGWADPALAAYAFESLDLVRFVFDSMWGQVREVGNLLYHSAQVTFSGFNPYVLYDSYVGNGRFVKLSVGMTAAFTTILVSLGTPHIVVNTLKLARDLKVRDRLGIRPLQAIDFIRKFPQRFVARQNWRQARYLRELASASVAEEESDRPEFTEQDHQAVAALLKELEAQEVTWVKRLGSFVKRLPIAGKVATSDNPRQRLTSFSAAMMHFIFSSCAFTLSGDSYARIWNGWFMFRSMLLRPVLSAMFVYYPNYFKTALRDHDGFTLPTVMNGGLRPFYSEEYLRFRSLFGDQTLNLLKAFEKKMIPIEAAIEEAALNSAFVALLKVIDDPDEFKKLIETQGMDSITDKSLESLATRNRNFFRLYFMRAADFAMKEVIREALLNSGELSDSDLAQMSLNDYKVAAEAHIGSVGLSESDAKAIVNKVVIKHNVHNEALEDANDSANLIEQFSNALHLRVASSVDPKNNRQVARYQAVNRQLSNPQAMARAVRATIASIVVDKPLELGLMLACLAGVSSGINQPLHDEMFGPNSWFYLGRYPFLTGYVTGLLVEVMADIWSKLQQDELHEGDFGQRPDEESAKKGFMSWYLKHLRASNNTLWQNHKHYIKMIWANMPAALVVMLATNVLTLGRFDLDIYVTGYLICYTIPLEGLAFKIEQAFELATGYFKKDIPERYISHPQVQKYLDRRISRARIWFNLYYKTYENILYSWLGNLQTIETPELGSRSFARWLFGGYTPTELIVKGLRKVGDSWLGEVPGVKPFLTGCEIVFTNNYTDGDKL